MGCQEEENKEECGMRRVGFWVCSALVFSSMVGTGVFTSLGFQAAVLPSPFVILAVWAVGGVVALCGALSYAELAAALPRSGGEYHFLSRIFHPAFGVMAGVVSVFVGFSAPLALGGMAFGSYFSRAFPEAPAGVAAPVVILSLALVHGLTLGVSGRFQVAATLFKATLIVGFLVAGFFLAEGANFRPARGDMMLVASPAFAVSLMFVMYSYSGWNSAVYIAGEVGDPGRVLPAALAAGTLVVTLLYVGLNAVFLASAPLSELQGKIEIGEVAARHLFGVSGGRLMSGIIAAGLIAALSALTWAGPRVAQVAGEDFRELSWFARKSGAGIPVQALAFQTAVVMVLLASGSFESVLLYAQFALVACSCLTIVGMLVLRWREPELSRPFRCPLFPFPPLAFLAVGLFSLIYTVAVRPVQAGAGILTLAAGVCLYFVVRKK